MPPAPKRRLTVLNNAPDDESAPRRPWQWVGFGVLAVFTAWLPLTGLAGVIVSRLVDRATDGASTDARARAVGVLVVSVVATYATALALGAALGGFLVGRWGTPGVGVRQAALAGLGASVVAAVATSIVYGPAHGMWLAAVVAVPMAALGGRLGVRARRR